MNFQEREDILKRHEKLLWWMTDQARCAFIAELRADYLFEEQQSCVYEIMSCPSNSISTSQSQSLSSDHSSSLEC